MNFDWLKHAFAVEMVPPGGIEPSPEQAAIIDKVVRQIVRRRLTTPALLFLEMSRPLNYVSAQAMHFLMPMVDAVADPTGWNHFAAFLESRGAIEHLCRRIEAAEAEAEQRERGGATGSNRPPDASARPDSAAESHDRP
jgi:hypothetical protein